MVAPVALETPAPRSRRAILATAIGGLGALVATALGRPAPASAAAGDSLIVGQANDGGTSQTVLLNAGTGSAFTLRTTNVSTGATGIFGWSSSTAANATRGVYGRADGANSSGVQGINGGTAGSGAAVKGLGGQNNGVDGQTANTNRYGVVGTNYGDLGDGVAGIAAANGTGVIGLSGGGYGVYGSSDGNNGVFGTSTTGTGVYGTSGGASAYGVYGSNLVALAIDAGAGVFGESVDGNGVYGTSTTGNAIYGVSTSGYAGNFNGAARISAFLEMPEMTAPASPTADRARIFVRDNGSSKSQLCVVFGSGAVQVLATEP